MEEMISQLLEKRFMRLSPEAFRIHIGPRMPDHLIMRIFTLRVTHLHKISKDVEAVLGRFQEFLRPMHYFIVYSENNDEEFKLAFCF